MPTESLTITTNRDGVFAVQHGEHHCDELTADESLWVVACFLMNRAAPYLRIDAEHVQTTTTE